VSSRAHAIYFDAPGTVSVREEALSPAPGDELVVSDLIGISHGTEMLFYRGPFPSGHDLEQLDSVRRTSGYPIKYGYMNVGHLDDGRRVFAFYPHQDRFFASPGTLLPVPESVETDDAVFYASMETAVQIVHDANPRLGEKVLVAGLGVIGHLVTRVLAHTGIRAIAADPLRERRERVEPYAWSVVDPNDSGSRQRVLELTEGRGADVSINTSAAAAGLQLCIDSTVSEGTVIEASWYGDSPATVQLGSAFHRRRLCIRSSQVSNLNPAMLPRWTRDRRTALAWELIAQTQPRALISHRFALGDAPAVYEQIAGAPRDVMQVVLEP
jgi:threonine dehydrogenase-like Zn-dependent dehydrogenase